MPRLVGLEVVVGLGSHSYSGIEVVVVRAVEGSVTGGLWRRVVGLGGGGEGSWRVEGCRSRLFAWREVGKCRLLLI